MTTQYDDIQGKRQSLPSAPRLSCGHRDTFGDGVCFNCDMNSNAEEAAGWLEIVTCREHRWDRIHSQRCWLAVGLLGATTAALAAALVMLGVI